MSGWQRFTYILMAVILALFGGLGILLATKGSGGSSSSPPADNNIDSYAECIQANGAILESYPEQCVSPTGSGTFTNPAQMLDVPTTN